MNEKNVPVDPVIQSHPDVAQPTRIVDPSEAVTGLSFVFGALGAVVGIVAALIVSPGMSVSLLFYCLLAALAGGSAGIVTGGMIGAIFAVMRGVTQRRDMTR